MPEWGVQNRQPLRHGLRCWTELTHPERGCDHGNQRVPVLGTSAWVSGIFHWRRHLEAQGQTGMRKQSDILGEIRTSTDIGKSRPFVEDGGSRQINGGKKKPEELGKQNKWGHFVWGHMAVPTRAAPEGALQGRARHRN